MIGEDTTGLICKRCLKFKTADTVDVPVCVCDVVPEKKVEILGKGNSPLFSSKCEVCGKVLMTNLEFDVFCNKCDTKKRLEYGLK